MQGIDKKKRTQMRVENEKLAKRLLRAERYIVRQEKIEKTLTRDQTSYLALLDQINEGAFIIEDGRFRFLNKALAGLVGSEPEKLFNRPVSDVIPKENEKTFVDRMSDQGMASHLLHVDGSTRVPVTVNWRNFSDVNKRAILGTTQSLPETGNGSGIVDTFDEQTRQSQKLEAIGTLAGGVAHDMNNVLGAIMSFASVLREECSDEHIQDLEDILAAARRGRDLTRNLLGFARKGKYRKEYISLSDTAFRVQRLLSRTVPKSISWKLNLADELPSVEGDFGQLSHAVMNICINAVEAMPDGGVLAVTTKSFHVESGDKDWPGIDDGDYVSLEVSDTGMGMEPSVVERIFEPFYSTKDKEGTGLGMAMVYGTVNNHGGVVSVKSLPDVGTTISLCFPATMAEKADLRTFPYLKPVRPVNTGCVLVVDDEELIRRSARRVLKTLGYTVLLARNGVQALEVLERHRNDVILVILDLMMPVMDGEETFFEIQKLDPKIPILISSGHTREGKAEELLRAGAVGFAQKPFDMREITQLVQFSSREV